jgi:hypothetical protein
MASISSNSRQRDQAGSAVIGPVLAFIAWLGDAVAHAFGNPREEAALQPPAVGVQPYGGTVIRRRRR